MAKQRRPSGKRPASAKKTARSEPAAAEAVEIIDWSPEREVRFSARSLDPSVIAIPLLRQLVDESTDIAREVAKRGAPRPRDYDVVIELHFEYPGGREKARERVRPLVDMLPARDDGTRPVLREASQYMFTRLRGDEIRKLVELDRVVPRPTARGAKRSRGERPPAPARAIYRIWPDFEIHALLVRSVTTVKADAAHKSFAAYGAGIVWAVLDSGVDATHPHFRAHQNLALGEQLQHYDFTLDDPLAEPASQQSALRDDFGHGTHVAGIIAGELEGKPSYGVVHAVSRRWSEDGNTETVPEQYASITGIAPRCRIVSMKVLDADGNGKSSTVIQALDRIQEINSHGRRILIHGVNISLGYDFDPEWFACGRSPLCVEVDRLVNSGVVVVVAAGNTGYGVQTTEVRGNVSSAIPLSINDPGNAALAITVGSTHRDLPYIYGVSYFSSKGPTGDGRLKPDLLAPGERILSCAAGRVKAAAAAEVSRAKFDYLEQSGTSTAASHVSGVVAAFLSVRREFIGQPGKVKQIVLQSASDMGRDRYFQGSGLVDLMRAIQTA